MTTELREARIKVVLDLEESKGEAKDLEKSVNKTARKQKKVGRDESEAKPGRGKVSSRQIAVRQLTSRGLYYALTELAKSIPVYGVIAALGIGAAELNERFGPGLEAMLKGLIPKATREAMEELGIDLNVSAEVSREWSEMKASFSSWSQAFDKTMSIAAATNLTGGAMSPAEGKEEFGMQREMARFQTEMLKTRRRILQMRGGEGISKALKDALEKASLPKSVGK